MIHPAGCCDYQIPLQRRHDGAWVGQALPGDPGMYHPGFVGECPHLVLSSTSVTLTCSESAAQQRLRPVYREWPLRIHQVSFDVGPAIAQAAENGALLRFRSGGTGDRGAVLRREQQLLLAIGDVDTSLGGVIGVEYDRRVDDDGLYWVKYLLGQPDTQLVWIDAEHCDLDAIRELIRNLPDGRVQFACRAITPAEASRLNNHLMPDRSLMRRPSVSWTNVDPRFETKDDWVAYVRSLPDTRPNDLHVRFDVDGTSATLREGEYAFLAPWHIYLHRIKRRGVPGQRTQMGVAHSGIDKATLIQSTCRIATRPEV